MHGPLTRELELTLLLRVVSVIVICCMTSILARVRASVARAELDPTRSEEIGFEDEIAASRTVSLPYSHVSDAEARSAPINKTADTLSNARIDRANEKGARAIGKKLP
jgi:hypothetical protein